MKTIKKNEENVMVPNNHIICGKNVSYSKDTHETGNNNNVLVVGTSGSGKTRSVVKPAILQAEGSYVISDPKGMLYKEMAPYLESKGYKVHKVDFTHPDKSVHYNPFVLCKNSQDVLKLVHVLTYGLKESKKTGNYDPFWDLATMILLMSLVGYMMETEDIPDDKKNIETLIDLIIEAKADGNHELDNRMTEHNAKFYKKHGEDSWAYKRYMQFKVAPEKTHNTICITTSAKLISFDTKEIHEMLRCNDLDFTKVGKDKTAVFVIVSDSDRSMDMLVNLFYTQFINALCTYADEKCKYGCLPVPVQFILDDFATNARIDNFENMISNIRSRNISAMIMVQSESQLREGYGDSASTIVNNCNTYLYLGGSDPEMAQKLAPRINITANTILNMPVGKCYVCRRGQEPVYTDVFDLEWYEKQMGYELDSIPNEPDKDQIA